MALKGSHNERKADVNIQCIVKVDRIYQNSTVDIYHKWTCSIFESNLMARIKLFDIIMYGIKLTS